MNFAEKAVIMNASEMNRALKRMAHEIIEANKGVDNLVLLGVQRRGVTMAKMLAQAIKQVEGHEVPQGALDITFYRDDLSKLGPTPQVSSTEMPFDVNEKIIILVDDVLYTGRTVRAALDVIMDWGRPQAIRLAVLVDRGHRELPLRADYVGKNVPTSRAENVKVRLVEDDGVEGIWIAPHGGPVRS